MEATDLPISHIYPRRNARKVVPATVDALVESIKEVGLLNPLRVRQVKGYHSGELTDIWEISAGVHRYEAAVRLGWDTIPCIIGEEDDLRAELIMIDENFCRAELTAAQRAQLTARRKEIYELLHPETRHQAFKGNQYESGCRKVCDNQPERFTTSMAAATGASERTIQLNAARGNKIDPQVLHRISGTHLDNGYYLDKLIKVPREDQMAKVEEDLKIVPINPKDTSRQRKAIKTEEEVIQMQANAIISAWNRACPQARQIAWRSMESPFPTMDDRFG